MADVVNEGSLAVRVREAVAAWSRSQVELVQLAGELASSSVWALEGAPTPAHWLAELAGVETCTAREWIRVGRALQGLDASADAFASGLLSYAKVRALTRVATPETEQELVDLARVTPANDLARVLAGWVASTSDPAELEAHQHRRRAVTRRLEPDGMTMFVCRLPPLVAGRFDAALTARVMRFRPAPRDGERWPSLAQQYADALDGLVTDGVGAAETEIVVHVRSDGCSLDDGTPVAGSVVERIAPESFLRALIHDAEGRPVNASSRRRHPSVRQRRVVKERDRVCVDCGSPALLEYDHDPPWHLTRRTVTEDLALRCAPCHNRRHCA